VVLNSAWDVAARIYTLFHEIGHLLTRTDSACFDYHAGAARSKDLLLERWCERFAAAALIPKDDVRGLLAKRLGWKHGAKADLAVAGKVARHYNVSLRASVLALIGVGAADQSLYAAIPESTDRKSGGGGGRPRDRSEISEGRFGDRTWSIFRRAIREDLMTRADAMTYLDVVDTEHNPRSARD
jgi:Zn-dependent peptidase ImmA (M78 family)